MARDFHHGLLVQWFRNASCIEGAKAPVYPGATKEQIGNLQ